MKKIILIVFCLLAFPVVASHIVGGEFELVHLGNYRFRLSLIYYFDLNNNTFTRPPEVEEPTITVAIFRKSDNVFMRFVTLANPIKTRVSYTQPECSSGEIRTDKLVYSAELTLPASQYNSPDGYYVIWERCCRNYVVSNIVSDEPPNVNSPNFQNAAGQTFYLHFPPVVKNNTAFINSSPRLFPPLNDYACPYKPYYADFGGTDDDGDSLVYSLVVPLSTHTSESFPPLRPAPYPLVRWEPGYGLHNIMNGNPDLRISRDGMLTVTPTTQGLYVFAVKCDEYRDGVKIGEIRRDFQMLVVDGCPQSDPPQILGKRSTDPGFIHDGNMSVTFSNDVPDGDRCIQVRVSDLDSSKPSTNPKDNYRERVTIKAIALGFKKDLTSILPSVKNAVLLNGSTVDFNVCFDKCPLTAGGGPYQVGIVAYDDACSLPLTDTLKITVTVEPPDNAKPRFVITNDVNETFDEGDPKQIWAVDAVDADGDAMDMFMVMQPPVFNFAQAGMTFKTTPQVGNRLPAEFTWDPNCTVFDFTKQTEFNLRFLVEDHDLCDLKDPDTLNFKLNITLPPNADPVISTDLPPDQLPPNTISRKVFQSLHFNVSGTDADNDKLVLKAEGEGFTLAQYNMIFPGDTDIANVASPYDWNILCNNVNPLQKQDFPLRFILVDDNNKCRVYKADTLTVNVRVSPPDNLKPLLTVTNTNPDLTFINREQSVILGQQISLALTATDDNNQPVDGVRIELVEATGNVEPRGYEFAPAEGIGSAQTTFAWLPDCSIFENALYRNSYTFTFRAIDDRCFNVKADTVEVNLNISDVESSTEDFIPPNIITPNGDAYNEFFAMVREETDSGALVSILPPDNCIGRFVSVRIYNRWGKEVYESKSRDFRWYPQSEAAGVYFYTLKYSHKEYKGSITLSN